MKLFFILGNQLFPLKYVDRFKKDHSFYMAEDHQLCTYEKHHKQKILLFLSSMRSYADNLKKNKFKIDYLKIEDKEFKDDYFKKLKKAITQKKITEISSFEIEDKFFEKKIFFFFKKNKIKINIIQSPMFLTSREEFKDYLSKNKKPFMANFYKSNRTKLNVLVDDKLKPKGGKWSFDDENRKKLPKDISLPDKPKVQNTLHTKTLAPIIEKEFKSHPGTTENFWLPTTRNGAEIWLDNFIKSKLNLFGDYEDAVSKRSNVLFHSALSPLINIGLITPNQILEKLKKIEDKVKLNSLEGYTRQIIGWREFMRGIYQNYDERLTKTNFFNHKNKMNKNWYKGETGLEPLDYAIKNAINHGWSHHIERLMILSNIMNLCQVEPRERFIILESIINLSI